MIARTWQGWVSTERPAGSGCFRGLRLAGVS